MKKMELSYVYGGFLEKKTGERLIGHFLKWEKKKAVPWSLFLDQLYAYDTVVESTGLCSWMLSSATTSSETMGQMIWPLCAFISS